MKIILNGTNYIFTAGHSVRDLIQTVCQKPQHVIAEINAVVVKSDLWSTTPVKDGDVIELVSFVGGG